MGTGREHVPFETSLCLQCAHAELKMEMVKESPLHPGMPKFTSTPAASCKADHCTHRCPIAPSALHGHESKWINVQLFELFFFDLEEFIHFFYLASLSCFVYQTAW